MTDATRKDFDQINESLESLRETAKGISVVAGSLKESGQIGERAHVLSKAIEGVRSDVQALRDRLE
jgi:hypothetical protein